MSGFVSGFSEDLLDWLGLGTELRRCWSSWSTVLIGLAANMVLFFALFRLLGAPAPAVAALWSGALLGAVGFEVLKQLSSLLLGVDQGHARPSRSFGIALILLVWINYTSRRDPVRRRVGADLRARRGRPREQRGARTRTPSRS